MFVRVVFSLPLGQSFLYRVPEGLQNRARSGVRVTAPLGKRKMGGFVVETFSSLPRSDLEIKDILDIPDDRPLWSTTFLDFSQKVSLEFTSPWGEILQASLPPSLGMKSRRRVLLTSSGREALEKDSLGRREKEIAGLLDEKKGRAPLFLQRKTGILDMSSLLNRMAKKGYVILDDAPEVPRGSIRSAVPAAPLQLKLAFPGGSREKALLAPLERQLDTHNYGAYLVVGPDVLRKRLYNILIRKALAHSGRVLYLVPEIFMTRPFFAELEETFGRLAVTFHGRMTAKQKETAWRNLQREGASIIVGTRSTLFFESKPLRLIIVDGEQDSSYLQTESPSYDARQAARIRAECEKAVVVFGSERPSVEAFYEAGRLGALLDFGQLPRRSKVRWVDHRLEKPLLSRILEEKIREGVGRGHPVILFLNRRGYAASMTCSACGHVPRCRRCDIPQVYHKKENAMVCHYCNGTTVLEEKCPECGGAFVLRKSIGTQALEEELKDVFPDIPLARFDQDTVSRPKDRDDVIRDFTKGKIPLLVGTQLLSFQPGVPAVPLLGIISPETLLGFADYRASQRTFQTVSQMMTFLDNSPDSTAVIQTPHPVPFSIEAAADGNFPSFYQREIDFRRLMNYPPYSSLAEVTLVGRDKRALAGKARAFRTLLEPFEPELEILGPAFATIGRMKDFYRIQVICKAARRKTIDHALRESLPRIRLKKTVRFSYSPFGNL